MHQPTVSAGRLKESASVHHRYPFFHQEENLSEDIKELFQDLSEVIHLAVALTQRIMDFFIQNLLPVLISVNGMIACVKV